MYIEANETVSNILNMCPKLATNNYLKRHNNVAAILHSNICQYHGTKTSKIEWKHHPDPVAERNEVKVLWEVEIRTDEVIPARRLYTVVIDNVHYSNNRRSSTTILESQR